MDQRIDRLEERMDRCEEKLEKQNVEFAETRVYVKEIYKMIEELKQQLKPSDKNNERMAKIAERLIWAIVTIVGYFIGRGGM